MELKKIAIRTGQGMKFLHLDDICCCIAKGRYTLITMLDGQEYLLTKVLKEIEGSLPEEDFFRTHKSFLINLNHITHYKSHSEYPILMANNERIQLAKRRKQEFHKRIREFASTL